MQEANTVVRALKATLKKKKKTHNLDDVLPKEIESMTFSVFLSAACCASHQENRQNCAALHLLAATLHC